MAVFFTSAKLVAYITFAVYVLMGEELVTEKTFVALGLLHPLRTNMTLFVPSAVQMLSEAEVTFSRIQVFQWPIFTSLCIN